MNVFLKITSIAALVIGGTNIAHAAINSDVEISGNIVTHTCDVSVPQPSYDLGNFAPVAFGTSGKENAVGAKHFILSVKNCAGNLEKSGDMLSVQVYETGTTNGADPSNFYGADNGTNAGITLTMSGGVPTGGTSVSPASPTYEIYKAVKDTDPITGKVWPIVVTAAMKAVAVPTPGAVKANLRFTMAE
ncbi:fimbrial protein [Serratia marcescens]|uniref:Type 1 fimbrial protein n=1 Tax=Serratia marcescens TaxID=615 RepID=A0A9X8VJ03_SERMA|nr:fimbrial protein [Serratia marcescens]MBS3894516.1 type 1 fimbrial protein [Serratia marcescens]